MDPTSTSLGVRRPPVLTALGVKQRAELEWLRVLKSRDDFTTHASWHKALRACAYDLHMARGDYYKAVAAFDAERAAFRADCARIAAELDSLKHAAE